MVLELERKTESYFQHTESTFPSDTHHSMKHQIIAKHIAEPKYPEADQNYLGSVRCLAVI